MKSLFKKWSSAALGAMVALMAISAAGSANAAVYRGVFDPTYGTAFQGLGWRGEALFNVPGNCGVTTETIFRDNASDCGSFGLAYVQEAQVRFYDTSNPSVDIAEITWGAYGSEAAASADGVDIFQLAFVAGELDQVSASLSGRLPSPLSESPPPFFDTFRNHFFSLSFLIDPAEYSGPLLSSFGPVECDNDCVFSTSDVFTFPPTFVITRVPEPGTLALVTLALIAGGSLTRHRRG